MSRPRRPLPPGFGIIWTTVALDLVGFGILFPVLARYAEDLGASPTTAGILVASFSVAQLVFSPIWGRLSDRVGRKPILIVSLVGTCIGSLLTGMAGALWLLFAARIIDGISGASVSVAQAAVTDVAPPDQRPRLLGLLGAAFGVGFAGGPVIGGLAALIDHRAPFFLAAAIAGINAAVAVRRLPETHPGVEQMAATSTSPAPSDLLPDSPSASPSDARLSNPLLRLLVVAFVSLTAFSGFEATFSLLMEDRFGLTESATYGVFAVIGIGLVIVQGGLIHAVHERMGERATLRAAIAINVAGLLLLAQDSGWASLVPALALLVAGQGLLSPTLSAAVAGRARAERRATALGVQQSAGGLARVAGPALAGLLFEHAGIAVPYLTGAGLLLLAFAAVPAGAPQVPMEPATPAPAPAP